jgi:hypothetical protein
VPVSATGDGAVDAAAVTKALLDGSGACVLDAVAPASGIRLSVSPTRDRIELAATVPGKVRPAWLLFRDGAPVGALAGVPGGWAWNCGGPCPAGAYRVEGRRDGAPWVFTNPVWIE